MGKGTVLDFLKKSVESPWKGHEDFVVWLVKALKPSVIVDLGVELGFSTFVLASPKIGKVYGIDSFKGDSFTTVSNPKKKFMAFSKMLNKRFGIDNIEIIEGEFSEVAKDWKLPIDILHIDGSHLYKDVKRDFRDWSKFVKKDGVILFHDVYVPQEKRFGVEKFFNEINLPKFRFLHSYGLGIVSKNENIIKNIILKTEQKIIPR